MYRETRKLGELISVGPATLRDFRLLGIESVAQLAGRDANQMYRKLARLRNDLPDRCVLDVFSAAVAQARDPRLPADQCRWWYWSRKRKAAGQARTGPQKPQRAPNR
jgi:hypothetical protein